MVNCVTTAVTWSSVLTNHRRSAFFIPHFTLRITQFRILPVAFNYGPCVGELELVWLVRSIGLVVISLWLVLRCHKFLQTLLHRIHYCKGRPRIFISTTFHILICVVVVISILILHPICQSAQFAKCAA